MAVVNRLLYAVGGYDGFNRLASMECYHPENDEWRFLAPMSTMRSGAGSHKILLLNSKGFCKVKNIPNIQNKTG